MNDARRRRLGLKDRILKAQKATRTSLVSLLENMIREAQERDAAGLCMHKLGKKFCPICIEWRTKVLLGVPGKRWATVYLKEKNYLEENQTVTVPLPVNKATEAILTMQKNGFWTIETGGPTFIPPDQIVKVVFNSD